MQVEPLVPGQQSRALSDMDEYIVSDKFRNETIDRLTKDVRDFDNAYARTEKSRKVDLERKTEKLNEKIHN